MSAKTNQRLETLRSLVYLSRPLGELSSDLSDFSWDYEGKPLVVFSSQIAEILGRYLSGEIDAGDLELWANMLECRDDIDFEENNEKQIEKVIHTLANPTLEGEITIDLCHRLLKALLQ